MHFTSVKFAASTRSTRRQHVKRIQMWCSKFMIPKRNFASRGNPREIADHQRKREFRIHWNVRNTALDRSNKINCFLIFDSGYFFTSLKKRVRLKDGRLWISFIALLSCLKLPEKVVIQFFCVYFVCLDFKLWHFCKLKSNKSLIVQQNINCNCYFFFVIFGLIRRIAFGFYNLLVLAHISIDDSHTLVAVILMDLVLKRWETEALL